MDRASDVSDNQLLPNFTSWHSAEIQSPAGQSSSLYSGQKDTAQLVASGVLPGISLVDESLEPQPDNRGTLTPPSDSAPPRAQHPAENAVPSNNQLITELGAVLFLRRNAAMQQLEERGLRALPELLRAQNQGDLETNRRVDQLIEQIGTAGIPLLAGALESNDPQLRAAAQTNIARLSLESILDYVGAANNDPQRLQQAQRILAGRNGWEDQVSATFVRDNENGRLPPNDARDFRRAVTGAQLLQSHTNVFHLSLEEGRFLLGQGNHPASLNSLDRSLTTLDRHLAGDTSRILLAVDFAQQLRDHLASTAGQALPQEVRTAITERIARARALQDRFSGDN